MSRFAQRRRERLGELEARLRRFDPSLRLAERARTLDQLSARLRAGASLRLTQASAGFEQTAPRLVPALRSLLERAERRWSVLQTGLLGNDPESILQKGYAIVTFDGAIVRDPASVPVGASIAARVARGTLSARVEAKESHGNERLG